MKSLFLYLIIFFGIIFFACKSDKDKSDENDKSFNELSIDELNLEQLKEKIRENPKRPELFVNRAKLQFEKANIDEAINDIKIALVLDSLNTDYYITLSEYKLTKGQSGRARDALNKALEIDEFNAEARLKLAQIYFYVQMYNQAMREIANLEENKLDDEESHFLKALIFYEQDYIDNAISSLRKSIDFNRNYWQAYNLLGLIYSQKNNPLAVEYFVTAVRLFPENLEIRLNAGIVFQDFNRPKDAVEQYKYILSVDTTVYNAHFNLGWVYLDFLGEYEKAIDAFSNAIELDPESYPAYYNKGFAYEALGELSKAESKYRKALEIKPNYELAVRGLNDVIAKQRR